MKLFLSSCAAILISGALTLCAQAGPEAVRIMPLGDSITDADPGYRGPLYNLLTQQGFKVEFVGSKTGNPEKSPSPHHEGHGGFTIGPGKSKGDAWSGGKGNIYDNVETWLAIKPQFVLLLIGVNDYFNVGDLQPGYKPDEKGAERLGGLLDKIHATSPDSRILVASILPVKWSAEFAKPLNAGLPAQVASRPYATFVDMNTKAGFTGPDWSNDGLHPSDSGYAKIAAVWAEALSPLLKAP